MHESSSHIAAVLGTLAVLLFSSVGDVGAGENSAAAEAVLQSAAQSVAGGDLPAATIALLTLDGQEVPATLRTQADLLLGIVLLRQGRPEEAALRLEAATSHPVLADYALYNLAQAQRQADKRDLAAATLGRLVEQHPQSLFAQRAAREIPRDFLEGGRLTEAEEAARTYLAAAPSGNQGDVRLALGEALLRTGRTDEAEEVFRRLWIELPASPESQRAKDLLGSLPAARPFTDEEQFQRATTLYQLGRYVLAIPELTPFASAGSARETQVRLMLALSAFNIRQYTQAAQWLEPLKTSAGADRAEVLFWLGRSAGRLGDNGKFTEYLTLVADSATRSRRSEEALYLLAQAAADDADVAASRAYLGRLLREYPKGAWTDVALWLQGWLAYKQREFSGAVASWERLATDEPGSRWRTPALYWRGRALEIMKQPAKAVQVYRTLLETALDQPYYHLRASERLIVLTKKAAPPSVPLAAPALSAGAANGLHATKGRALRDLGLTDEAVEEWSEQVRSRAADRRSLAEACGVFLDLKRYEKAVWVGNRILRPLLVQEGGKAPISGFWQCTYPLGHLDLVRQHATSRQIDPYLALALIREESGFDPHALSRTGARGLMQLMPQTADLTAREHKLQSVAPLALETPEVNIQLGVNHLADLLRDFGGNLSLTVAAYNAGKQAVQRWVQRYGFAEEVEFTEDIPFTETRNYVKRVLGSYDRYKSLYRPVSAESRVPSAEKKPTEATRRRAGAPGRGAKGQ